MNVLIAIAELCRATASFGTTWTITANFQHKCQVYYIDCIDKKYKENRKNMLPEYILLSECVKEKK